MINILEKYLNKLGVKNYSELTEEEKETYRLWETSLNGRKLTDEDIKTFLLDELDTAIGKITETNLSKEDEIFRKVEIRFIKKVISFLDAPMKEKAIIENQIASKL